MHYHCTNQTVIQFINTLQGCTTPHTKKLNTLRALRVLQTVIHLKKFIFGVCTTHNVKGAEKIIASCTIRNDNIF